MAAGGKAKANSTLRNGPNPSSLGGTKNNLIVHNNAYGKKRRRSRKTRRTKRKKTRTKIRRRGPPESKDPRARKWLSKTLIKPLK